MKSLTLVVCTLSTAFTVHAGDPRLRIEPAQPHPGGKLTVTFDPKGGPLEQSSTLKLVYGFTVYQDFRTPLPPKENRFVAEVAIPASAAYFWCWVEGKTPAEKDTNRGGVWDSYLYDDKGLPVENARESRASLYEVRGQSIDRYTAGLTLFEEELRAFPTNGRARGLWWALRFEDAGKSIEARDEILQEISAFVNSNLDKPWAYRAASLGYNNLGRNPEALEVIRRFVKRFPEGNSLDSDIEFFFGNFGSVADLESLQEGSKRWAANPRYWNSLLRSYEKLHAGPEKLRHPGEESLKLVPKDQDAFGFTRMDIAERWLANGVDPVAAERVAREAVGISELGQRYTDAANLLRDPRLASRTTVTAVHRSTLGWALFQQGRYDDAVRELKRAVEIREKEKIVARGVYYRLGQTLERLNRPAEAMDAYLRELAWGADQKRAREAAAALYANAHGGSGGFDAAVQGQVNQLIAEATSATEEPVQDVNQKLGRFDLRRPDGALIPISRFEGRIVVIEFWATWCGMCLASMENTQKLASQFPDDVVVLAVSTDGEETRGRAKPYLDSKGYRFALLFDDESRRDLAVPCVPARFLLDRKGQLRVREFGTGRSSELVFEKKLRALVAE